MLLLLAALAFAEPAASEVVLDDGQVLRGMVERQEDGSVIVTLGSGTMLRFPKEAIREVRAATRPAAAPAPLPAPSPGPSTAPAATGDLPIPGETPGRKPEKVTPAGWPRDPNRSRYLYSPSAYSLGAGHGYVSEKELVLTEAAFGITDFWDVQAGTSLITLLIPDGQFAVVGTKLSFKANNWLHLGAGAQALFTSEVALALPFATATIGSEDKHLSVSAGGLLSSFNGTTQTANGVLITVSGNWRLGPKASLVSENWFLVGNEISPTGEALYVVPSFAVRLFGPSFATDLGVVPIFLPDSGVPLLPVPWVGFTWNWALPYAKD